VLGSTAGELRRAIAGLSDAQLSTPEGPGQWSLRQVIQHLTDSELVLAFRSRMVLAHERPPLAAYDQELWAERLRYDQSPVAESLLDFERLRAANLRLLRAASPAQLERVGLHAERGTESVTQMIRNQAGHDVVHLRQMARIRAVIGA
jgi:hypothetical protein